MAAHAVKVHNIRMARLKERAQVAHLQALAAKQHANHLARIAQIRERQAHYQAHLANLQAAHEARVAAHEARLAEREAWVQQAAARRREQEAANRVSSAYGITQFPCR